MNDRPDQKNYRVTMYFQFPAWDERDGISIDEVASSKSEAIRRARREMDAAGHCIGGRGRYWFRAVEEESV